MAFSAASKANVPLLDGLKQLDTAAICDADKQVRASNDNAYRGIQLLCDLQKLPTMKTTIMAGVARTVKLSHKNDFMGVIQGILEADAGEVVVVDAMHSNLAVAGELLAAEAELRQVEGLIILHGAMRDSAGLRELTKICCFAQSVTPYAGTCMHPAKMQNTMYYSNDVIIQSGDIILGDEDGVLVGCVDTMARLLPIASNIHATESVVRSKQHEGSSLVSMCNIQDHIEKRLKSKDSQFAFTI